MLTIASGWQFWTIIGGGAAVTALLCALVGSPRWFRRGHVRRPLATVHTGDKRVAEHAARAA